MSTSLGGGSDWSTLDILCLSLYSDDTGDIAFVAIIFVSGNDFYSYRLAKRAEIITNYKYTYRAYSKS
jgi:hypothetical protein